MSTCQWSLWNTMSANNPIGRTTDPKAQVRESYNRIAAAYLSSRRRDSPDVALLDDLVVRLPRARVLDAGCGAGVPIAQKLAAEGPEPPPRKHHVSQVRSPPFP